MPYEFLGEYLDENGLPVEGAKVIANLRENGDVIGIAFTDSEGNFTIDSLDDPVVAYITVLQDGFIPQIFDQVVAEFYGDPTPDPITIFVTVALRPSTANIYGAADSTDGTPFGVVNPDPGLVAGSSVHRFDTAVGFNQFEIWTPDDLGDLGYFNVSIDYSGGTFSTALPGKLSFGYPINTGIDLWTAADVGLTYAVTFSP